MTYPRRRVTRRSHWTLPVLVAAVMALLALPGPVAGAQPQTKHYDSNVSPTSVYVGVATAVTVTLHNETDSIQSFGSAELNLGSLPATAISAVTNNAGWSGQVAGTSPLLVLFTSGAQPAIAPGGTLTVGFTLTAPSAQAVSVTTEVKQSNDFSGSGNAFVDLAANPQTISVTPAVLAFVQQPSTVQAGTASKPVYMCPPVSVSVTEGAGGAGIPGLAVTLANGGASDPGLYYDGRALSSAGVAAVTDQNGVATFGDSGCSSSGLGAANIGAGYTLSASSPAAADPVASAPFSVVQSFVSCSGTTTCTTGTLTGSVVTGMKGTVDSTGSAATGSYGLIGSFGQGGLTCDSQVATGNADPLVAQVVSVPSGQSVYTLITMTFPKSVVNSLADNGTPLMPVCAGATAPFQGSADITGATYPYQGLLPDCTASYLGDPGQLCVVSRAKKAASETIQIYAGAGFSGDPMFW